MKIIKIIVNFFERQQSIFLLLLRISLGCVFFQTGLGKFMHFDRTIRFFASLGIPFPEINTFLASGTELVGGICLILGLFTQLISLPLAFVMVIAIITSELGDLHSIVDLFRLKEWVYCMGFLLFSSIGSGKWSLDHVWLNKKSQG